jgi:hypothetical protein
MLAGEFYSNSYSNQVPLDAIILRRTMAVANFRKHKWSRRLRKYPDISLYSFKVLMKEFEIVHR